MGILNFTKMTNTIWCLIVNQFIKMLRFIFECSNLQDLKLARNWNYFHQKLMTLIFSEMFLETKWKRRNEKRVCWEILEIQNVWSIISSHLQAFRQYSNGDETLERRKTKEKDFSEFFSQKFLYGKDLLEEITPIGGK